MPGVLANVTIAGACSVTWKGIDLGHTLAGIDIKPGRTFKDVIVDKYGSMPLDKVLTGASLDIDITLAEAMWKVIGDVAIPETSSYDGGVGKQRADFGADAGYSLRQDAGLLVIHPLKNGDASEDVTIYRAVSSAAILLPYHIDAQKAVKVTMSALVDESYSSGRRLGHYGFAAVS